MLLCRLRERFITTERRFLYVFDQGVDSDGWGLSHCPVSCLPSATAATSTGSAASHPSPRALLVGDEAFH
ncbi:hypothetical protein AMELA_G00147160 [Ameiurus melas]|uniref:Uncharacterized protein n=1 Tax=Ameiurus melas TaxID=219545 RepID=A0A7J6AGU1_AMEME|nr:hypothetical protein AMELA_G00147160 [Ameiurus melas]